MSAGFTVKFWSKLQRTSWIGPLTSIGSTSTNHEVDFCLPGNAKLEGQVQTLKANAAGMEMRLQGAEERGRELEETLRLALEEVEARKAEQRACEEAQDSLSSQLEALKVCTKIVHVGVLCDTLFG